MNITIETITPDMASKYLQLNTGNFRPHDNSRVKRYASEMQLGRWKETGDSIKFNGKILIDGQHRLMACVKAETPFTTVVVRDAVGAEFVDRGKPRTVGQWLRHGGIKNYNFAAAVSRSVLCHDGGLWDQKGWGVGDYLDSDIIKFATDNNDAIQSAFHLVRSQTFLSKTLLGTVVILGSRTEGRVNVPENNSTAIWFTDGLRTGVGLSEIDALLHMRNRLANDAVKTNSMSLYLKRQMLSKVGNMTVQGCECAGPNALMLRFTGPAQTKPIKFIMEAE